MDFSHLGAPPPDITAKDFIEWYHSLNPELQKIVNERLQELAENNKAISGAKLQACVFFFDE